MVTPVFFSLLTTCMYGGYVHLQKLSGECREERVERMMKGRAQFPGLQTTWYCTVQCSLFLHSQILLLYAYYLYGTGRGKTL